MTMVTCQYCGEKIGGTTVPHECVGALKATIKHLSEAYNGSANENSRLRLEVQRLKKTNKRQRKFMRHAEKLMALYAKFAVASQSEENAGEVEE